MICDVWWPLDAYAPAEITAVVCTAADFSTSCSRGGPTGQGGRQPRRVLPDSLVAQARLRHGLLRIDELPGRARTSLRRQGLVEVQPRVVAASTQPLDSLALVHAVAMSLPTPYAFVSDTALWLHGALPPPAVVEVGMPATRGLAVRAPAVGRRLAPALLAGRVHRLGLPAVRLEVAAVQHVARLPPAQALQLLEDLLRERRTTVPRLRDVLRRGLAGSATTRRLLGELTDGDLELHKRRLRRALQAAGFALESEVPLVSVGGASCYLDLLHRPSWRAVEVDGALWHGGRDQQRVDRRRDRWVLREHGITTLRVAVVEVRDDLPAVVEELAAMLR